MNKDLLTVSGLGTEDVARILDRSAWLKKAKKDGVVHHPLKGKSLGMIFEKSSTRTRVSFEVGMYQLGGQALFLSAQDLQMGRGEPIADTARTLSRYVDGIMIRTYSQTTVEELARYATIPVVNGLTDLHHPCQALADLFTIQEKRGTVTGLRFCYIGDGNNMAHSLIEACVKVGMHASLACPPGYEPDAGILREAKQVAAQTGAELTLSSDPRKAAKGADIVYTDVWASMGQEKEHAERVKAFTGYQIDEKLMKVAAPEALVMHCLPAHRGEEIAASVIDGPQSAVFDQAENRLHTQKAILELLMGR
jgi:ornithine carbamoyltransferase